MAITAIMQVRNETDFEVIVSNLEWPSDTGGGRGRLAARETKDLEMWIPWCQEESSFARRSIRVAIGPGDFAVWQAWFEDGDLVRSDGGVAAAW